MTKRVESLPESKKKKKKILCDKRILRINVDESQTLRVQYSATRGNISAINPNQCI